jgi:hypothetical protein
MFSTEVTVVESRRQDVRLPVDLRARYGSAGSPTRALCRILDVTKRGARLRVYCDLEPNTTITLVLPMSGAVRARVMWANDFEAGCRFHTPLAESELDTIFRLGHA